RSRIAAAGLLSPAGHHYVACDFESEEFGENLLRSGFEPASRSFFAWLGVSYYLTRDAIAQTLRSVRGLLRAGGELTLDYFDPSAFSDQSPEVKRMFAAAASRGEPYLTAFEDIAAYARDFAFTVTQDLGQQEQVERYFPGRKDGLKPWP